MSEDEGINSGMLSTVIRKGGVGVKAVLTLLVREAGAGDGRLKKTDFLDDQAICEYELDAVLILQCHLGGQLALGDVLAHLIRLECVF